MALAWCDGSALGRLAQHDFNLCQKSRDTPQGGRGGPDGIWARRWPPRSACAVNPPHRRCRMVLGSLPALLGLIVVVPVLGHARWHLYRKMVAR